MGMRMLQRILARLAASHRHVRHLMAIGQRRDPKVWIVALLGTALGLGVFLMMLIWVGALRLAVKSLR
jgi:hypothetical protein